MSKNECCSKTVYFPRKTNKNKQNIFLFLKRARQGLTLLLRIFISDEESGLHSSLFWKWFVWNVWYFLFFESL